MAEDAVIGGNFADAASYEVSFSEAALLLGDKVLETGLLDSYFYPMCYLFMGCTDRPPPSGCSATLGLR